MITIRTAALAPLVAVLAACSSTSGTGGTVVAPERAVRPATTAAGPAAGTATSPAPRSAAARPAPVHVKLLNTDGATYGVGMPVIAFFSRRITSAAALQAATRATVDGRPVEGAWYFETSGYYPGYPIEAHFRPRSYWPAHAHVHVDIPVRGRSAGRGLAFDDSLFSDFSTGARHIAVVREATHTMTVTSDGRAWGTFPVSLGDPVASPTSYGTKVIMEKGRDISMRGQGYVDPHVEYTQRLTYGGEYLHSAPWNCTGRPGCTGPRNDIGHADSSNGCTNLRPADAARLYGFLRVGDVVQFPDAPGRAMTLEAGYGDWNVSWAQWRTGGLVSTSA